MLCGLANEMVGTPGAGPASELFYIQLGLAKLALDVGRAAFAITARDNLSVSRAGQAA